MALAFGSFERGVCLALELVVVRVEGFARELRLCVEFPHREHMAVGPFKACGRGSLAPTSA